MFLTCLDLDQVCQKKFNKNKDLIVQIPKENSFIFLNTNSGMSKNVDFLEEVLEHFGKDAEIIVVSCY